ncbi:MAG: hypothetical protein ACYDHN_17185 [Solirubrobacteraceae bacterium]
MFLLRHTRLLALAGATATLATAPTTSVAKSSKTTAPLVKAHALLSSRELWATIDVCSPTDQPNTVGIRGSMPGDKNPRDKMYMSFRLQYLNATGQWVDLASGSTPSYVTVGGATAPREGGRSFQLVPVPGKPAAKLRGVVDFQWRRNKKVLLTAVRATVAGHASVAGADPAGFSAATCLIG